MKRYSVLPSSKKEKQTLNWGLNFLIFPLKRKPRTSALFAHLEKAKAGRLSKQLLHNEVKSAASWPSSQVNQGWRTGGRPLHKLVIVCRSPFSNREQTRHQPARATGCRVWPDASSAIRERTGKWMSPCIWLTPAPNFLSLGCHVAHTHQGCAEGEVLHALPHPASSSPRTSVALGPVSQSTHHADARSPEHSCTPPSAAV